MVGATRTTPVIGAAPSVVTLDHAHVGLARAHHRHTELGDAVGAGEQLGDGDAIDPQRRDAGEAGPRSSAISPVRSVSTEASLTASGVTPVGLPPSQATASATTTSASPDLMECVGEGWWEGRPGVELVAVC